MSNARITSRTIQVAVRLPLDVHEALAARGRPVSTQLVEIAKAAVLPGAEILPEDDGE
jgi:hypothetical protein